MTVDIDHLARSWLPVVTGRISLIAPLFAALVAREVSEPVVTPSSSEVARTPAAPNIVIIRGGRSRLWRTARAAQSCHYSLSYGT